MADTQADSNVFSVRIVSIDYYMAAAISDLDFCYSSFQDIDWDFVFLGFLGNQTRFRFLTTRVGMCFAFS
ncbi:DNA polymerase zeta catalytic subunit [Fagus crenata]